VTKKFGIFDTVLTFNLLIPVHNSDDTFTAPLISDSYTEVLPLVFLKWTIWIMWSRVRNSCRSSL